MKSLRNRNQLLLLLEFNAFPRYVVKMLSEYVESNNKYDNLGDFLSWLCSKTDIYSYLFTNGNWCDVGNPDSYIEAFRFYMEHSVAESVEIDKTSKIIKSVVIEEGAVMRGRSIIGHYVYIGRDCEILSSDISDSVIFDGAILKRAKV